MRIGELAERTGCEVTTIRYYEQEALLPPPQRTASGYRNYDANALGELEFILHCRTLGMTLEEIRTLQRCKAKPDEGCEAVNQLLDTHLAHLHQQISSLQLLALQLEQLRNRCQQSSKVAECGILQELTQGRSPAKSCCSSVAGK